MSEIRIGFQTVPIYFQELQSKLGNGRDKVSSLEKDKQALATHIATEDVVVLQQRLTLLRKQWAEMENQVVWIGEIKYYILKFLKIHCNRPNGAQRR